MCLRAMRGKSWIFRKQVGGSEDDGRFKEKS
nr:MAG TPA: hypothetical protein [Caudoviricetes sp.]